MTNYIMTPERTEAALMCALTTKSENKELSESAKKIIEDFGVIWVQSLAEEVIELRELLRRSLPYVEIYFYDMLNEGGTSNDPCDLIDAIEKAINLPQGEGEE